MRRVLDHDAHLQERALARCTSPDAEKVEPPDPAECSQQTKRVRGLNGFKLTRLSGIRVDSFPAGDNRRAPATNPAAKSPANSSVSTAHPSHRAVAVLVIHPANTLKNTVASRHFPFCRVTARRPAHGPCRRGRSVCPRAA